MDQKKTEPDHEKKLGKIIRDDLRRNDLTQTFKRDYRELKEFFLDDRGKTRLKKMGWFKRSIFTFWWLIRSLFLKLTPLRRILLLIALIMLLLSGSARSAAGEIQVNVNFSILGGLTLLFVLMLELKDKLLARSELEAGRAVQRALMPVRSPSVPKWSTWLYTRTANEVGGDLIDFQQIDGTRFGISLGDVSGKGLSAALLMAKLQATLRALAPDCGSLGELGTKINKIIHRDCPRGTFSSLVYLEINTGSDRINFLNAGHFSPITICGGKIEELPKGDPGIGIFPATVYGEKHVDFRKGDIIFIYSDGLTDAKNEAGEFYGSERMFELLPRLSEYPASQIGEKFVEDITSFTGNAPIYDDLSFVILKRVG